MRCENSKVCSGSRCSVGVNLPRAVMKAGDRKPEVHVGVMWSELGDAWATDLTLLPTANMMGGGQADGTA